MRRPLLLPVLLLASPLLAAEPERSPYRDHGKLLVYLDEAGQEQPVKSPADWQRRREHVLAGMQLAMGKFPDDSRRVPLDVRITEEVDTPKYIRKKLTYAAEANDRVPAFLLVPKKLAGKTPAVLCLHPTHDRGKDQVVGLLGKPTRFYGHELAERGFICLVPDYPTFGDYAGCELAKLGYSGGTMKAIWNNVRAVDLLQSLPEVDGERIGAIGHSLGGHNALFTAAFEPRLAAVATSCGFTAFRHYYHGNLKGWASDRYMPRIRDVYQLDASQMPFDFPEVLATVAPRPLWINAPLPDNNFEAFGVRKCVEPAREVFRLFQAEPQIRLLSPDGAHDFPDPIRQDLYAWLERTLRRGEKQGE